MSKATKLVVNVNAETMDALRHLAAASGVTVTEALRRSVALYTYLDRETAAGHQVQVAGRCWTRDLEVGGA